MRSYTLIIKNIYLHIGNSVLIVGSDRFCFSAAQRQVKLYESLQVLRFAGYWFTTSGKCHGSSHGKVGLARTGRTHAAGDGVLLDGLHVVLLAHGLGLDGLALGGDADPHLCGSRPSTPRMG